MLKRNISGNELFDVSNITNKKLNTVNYENVASRIGYPFNINYVDGLNHSYRQKSLDVTIRDYSIFGMYESKKISNIIPPATNKGNINLSKTLPIIFPPFLTPLPIVEKP